MWEKVRTFALGFGPQVAASESELNNEALCSFLLGKREKFPTECKASMTVRAVYGVDCLHFFIPR